MKNYFLAVTWQLYRFPCHSVTDWLPVLKNTTKVHSEGLVTLETCYQSEEETWPDHFWGKNSDFRKDFRFSENCWFSRIFLFSDIRNILIFWNKFHIFEKIPYFWEKNHILKDFRFLKKKIIILEKFLIFGKSLDFLKIFRFSEKF